MLDLLDGVKEGGQEGGRRHQAYSAPVDIEMPRSGATVQTTSEHPAVTWCRAFMAYVPQEASDADQDYGVVRAACVKIVASPEGDGWRAWGLTLDEASVLANAKRKWPDGRVGTFDHVYASDGLRSSCAAWLAAWADEPMDDAPRLQATRSACEKITTATGGVPPRLSWHEADAIRLMVEDAREWASVQEFAATVPLRERTALGHMWDRLRGRR